MGRRGEGVYKCTELTLLEAYLSPSGAQPTCVKHKVREVLCEASRE